MATKALLAMYLNLAASDLSDHVRGVTLALDASQLNSEAMGDAWEETTGGLKSGTLSFEVLDDFAASSIDSILWSAFSTGTNVAFEVRPDSAVVGTTNPKYTGSVHPSQFQMGGKLNEMATKSLTWKVSGTVARATS